MAKSLVNIHIIVSRAHAHTHTQLKIKQIEIHIGKQRFSKITQKKEKTAKVNFVLSVVPWLWSHPFLFIVCEESEKKECDEEKRKSYCNADPFRWLSWQQFCHLGHNHLSLPLSSSCYYQIRFLVAKMWPLPISWCQFRTSNASTTNRWQTKWQERKKKKLRTAKKKHMNMLYAYIKMHIIFVVISKNSQQWWN